LPATGSIHFGVCPSHDCARSYRQGKGIRTGLAQWHTAAMVPGAGGASAAHDPSIDGACSVVLQARPHPRGTCDVCGKALLFTSVSPELGECPACLHSYREEDLARDACPECGATVSITEEQRRRMDAHVVIAEILHTLPHLRHHGYLDRLYASVNGGASASGRPGVSY